MLLEYSSLQMLLTHGNAQVQLIIEIMVQEDLPITS